MVENLTLEEPEKQKPNFLRVFPSKNPLWIKSPDFYFSGKFAGRKRLGGKEFQNGS